MAYTEIVTMFCYVEAFGCGRHDSHVFVEAVEKEFMKQELNEEIKKILKEIEFFSPAGIIDISGQITKMAIKHGLDSPELTQLQEEARRAA